jgi:hypothetical protein
MLQEPSQCSASLMEWAEARIVDLGCVRDDDGQVWVDDPVFCFALCLRADAFEWADGDGAP